MRIALKIDAESFRGTLVGVPRLVELLRRHEAQASFFFTLGPDRSGRALRRRLAQRSAGLSPLQHHGLMPLFYGTLLPGPDIGRRCADILRGVRDAGFEAALQGWDATAWQDRVGRADAPWTAAETQRGIDGFRRVFGEEPAARGAAGWQLNAHALRLTQRLGFSYCSDCRGSHPFMPVLDAEIVLCPQLPTTLPTLDELIGRDGLAAENVHEHLLALTATETPHGHVFTLRAELEGGPLLPAFERLLASWRAQGHELVALRELRAGLDAAKLPRHELLPGRVAGRAGSVMLQGAEFLAEFEPGNGSALAPEADFNNNPDRT